MSECCGPPQSCCCDAPPEYAYSPQLFVTGTVDTLAGPVERISTQLGASDKRGAVRVRLGIRRGDYRVRPALYAVGSPDDTSPVLVTCNYKLTFDVVRRELAGRDAWLLVLDTRGVNVWCAAGKGTFGTAEVVRMVRKVRLDQIVGHTRLVLPQLGATGVAGHEVRSRCGFSVNWGPVRASDLPIFLDAGMTATPEMRAVRFPLADRAKLVGVEMSVLWRRTSLVLLGLAAVIAIVLSQVAPEMLGRFGLTVLACILGVLAGAAVAPLLLPWVPGRAFSLKGALVGVAVVGGTVAVVTAGDVPLWDWGLVAIGTAIASYTAMNFTGSSTFTSPSGVDWEMRRAIPLQLAALTAGIALIVVSLIAG